MIVNLRIKDGALVIHLILYMSPTFLERQKHNGQRRILFI